MCRMLPVTSTSEFLAWKRVVDFKLKILLASFCICLLLSHKDFLHAQCVPASVLGAEDIEELQGRRT